MLSRKRKVKLIAVILMLNLLTQLILPTLSAEVFATDEVAEGSGTTEETQEITRNYEIKEEETWDVSANNDGSVKAKWTRSDRTIVISGTGEMKDWEYNSTEDWHNNDYIQLVEKVIIKQGVTTIGNYAFKGFCRLKSIEIPSSITKIGFGTFNECSSIEFINIPSSVVSIGFENFKGCNSLKEINVESQNEIYISENGILFNKIKTQILKYPPCKEDITEYAIPEGVTSIEMNAFSGCSSLASINIPSSVTSIGSYAFSRCSSLTNITIPEGVTSIGDAAFWGCSSISSITIPSSVTSIGSWTFLGCSSLESIIIPERVTSIGNNAIDKTTLIYAKANTEAHRYAERNQQSYILDDTAPNITYTPNDGSKAQKKYEIKIDVVDNGVGLNESSLKYEWTQSATEPAKEELSQTFNNGDIIKKSDGDGKWYLWVYAKDNLENEVITSKEFNFDNTAPNILSVTGNPTEMTNQNVTITVKATDTGSGIKGYSFDDGKTWQTENSKEYTENTNGITIKVKDEVENISSYKEILNITKIDKVAPDIKVNYSTEEVTNQNVTVTITSDEQLQKVEGWNLSEDKQTLTKEYSENDTETVKIKDLAGNESNAQVKITNIDKVAPTCKVEYSTTQSTKENVIVTITSNEQMQEVQGWTLSQDKLKLTKQYSDNKKEELILKDLAGNESKVSIKITNIDKIAPTCKIEYSTTQPTQENVTVTITANEQIQETEGWTLSQDKLKLTKKYTENVEEKITIKDVLGNITTVNIKISNIDKESPTADVKYSITEATNKDVEVTITSNEKLQELEGWTLSQDKLKLTKTYTKNVEEKITIKDIAGNTTTVNVKISNIDKTIPAITKGDINKDGQINTVDMIKILRHIAVTKNQETEEKNPTWKLTGELFTIADINEDGQVNTTDLLKILRHISASKDDEIKEKHPDWILTI